MKWLRFWAFYGIAHPQDRYDYEFYSPMMRSDSLQSVRLSQAQRAAVKRILASAPRVQIR